MSKKYAIFITVLFCAFLGTFFAANALTPDKDFSPVENRALAQAPALSTQSLLSGDFMADFEEYVTDQFDQHTLIPRFDAPTDERGSQRCDKNFALVDTFAGLSDVPVYFSLIPGKVSVWSHLLPEGAPNGDEGVYLARGAQATARWLDVNAALTAHKNEPIYYRTGHH